MSTENTKYNLTPEVIERSEVQGMPENMSEWIDSLRPNELQDWFLIATREKNQNSQVELTQATMVAIVLLSYELDTRDVHLSADKIHELVAKFFVNLILEKGKRDGLYELPNGLTLARDPQVNLTPLGKEVLKKINL